MIKYGYAVIRRNRMRIKAVVPHQYNVTVRGYGFRFSQTTDDFTKP